MFKKQAAKNSFYYNLQIAKILFYKQGLPRGWQNIYQRDMAITTCRLLILTQT